jgi:hypothetical protein
VRAVPGASGGRVVGSTGYGSPAGDVTFHGVAVDAAGTYAVTIFYVSPDAATHRLALSVNGRVAPVLNFPAVRAVGSVRTVVTLAAGGNTLRFSNAGRAHGPDLDRITVQRV